jgi:hypothetical protein
VVEDEAAEETAEVEPREELEEDAVSVCSEKRMLTGDDPLGSSEESYVFSEASDT